MRKNILVQYEGGGYDGCFWEWNYFYIDKGGGFHNVFSSGRAGIKNLEDAKRELEKEGPFIYDMGSEEEIKSFVTESNAVNVTGVLQFFEDNEELGVEFFVVCSECGRKITDKDDIRLENWHGCGGIATTADLLLCYECHISGTCECCESYVGETEIVKVNSDEHRGLEYICTGCRDYHDEERE